MYYYDDDVGACIAVNRLHPPERQLWSLAHGYMHFLAHRYQPIARIEGAYERHSRRERLADQGALHLTMPSSEVQARSSKVKRSKGHLTPADLCIMANYFGVSVAALTRRLEEMSILKTGTWDMLKDMGFKVRETQERLGIDRPDRAEMLPFRYRYLALEALQKGAISEKQFADYLRVDRLDARDMKQQLLTHATDITVDDMIDIDLSQSLSSYG
jgi:Zn-dependent peptidase ImmA (M78 family)